MNDSVLVTEKNDIVSLTFNRPHQLNSFSADLVDGLHNALDALDAAAPKLVVFRANGKGFSGGLDLSNLDTETDGDLLLRLVNIEQLLQRIRHAPFATAALVHGACYGAAADLVLACRARIATPDARFLMPGMRFGIVLGTRRLRDTVGESNAYQLLDRLKPFKTDEAAECGFITRVADADDWDNVIEETAGNVAAFTKAAYAMRVSSLTPDTRAEDMQALVLSVAAGSIKTRMVEYVAQVKAERQARSQGE